MPPSLVGRVLLLAGLGAITGCAASGRRDSDQPGADPAGSPTVMQSFTPIDSTQPQSSAPSGARLDEGKLNTAGSVVDYANFCKQELGLSLAQLAPWNCLEGTEIPVTIDGKPIADTAYPGLQSGQIGCDKPSWLSGTGCINYAFVQRRKLSADVDAMLLCRMRTWTNAKSKAQRLAAYQAAPTAASFRDYYGFDSIGLIMSNAKTGKTCFFDWVGLAYGGYVPSPDDARMPALSSMPTPKPPVNMTAAQLGSMNWQRSALNTWKAPKDVAAVDDCVKCHDSGPWKRSPWIKQALPGVEVPTNDLKVPFSVVGHVFDPWRTKFPLRSISTDPVLNGTTRETQVCTSCHRMGTQATCDDHLEFSTGLKFPAKLSGSAQKAIGRIWMPPNIATTDMTSDQVAASWTAHYGKHVDAMRCCCKNPTGIGCLSQDFSQPDATIIHGGGPQVCVP